MMEKILRFLFDYQKIEGDPELSSVIDDTHSRYDKKRFRVVSLTDDSLGVVSAAGEHVPETQRPPRQSGEPATEQSFQGERDNNDNNK